MIYLPYLLPRHQSSVMSSIGTLVLIQNKCLMSFDGGMNVEEHILAFTAWRWIISLFRVRIFHSLSQR